MELNNTFVVSLLILIGLVALVFAIILSLPKRERNADREFWVLKKTWQQKDGACEIVSEIVGVSDCEESLFLKMSELISRDYRLYFEKDDVVKLHSEDDDSLVFCYYAGEYETADRFVEYELIKTSYIE